MKAYAISVLLSKAGHGRDLITILSGDGHAHCHLDARRPRRLDALSCQLEGSLSPYGIVCLFCSFQADLYQTAAAFHEATGDVSRDEGAIGEDTGWKAQATRGRWGAWGGWSSR